jgi:antitoxin component of MazEF toxin-antitoxin module
VSRPHQIGTQLVYKVKLRDVGNAKVITIPEDVIRDLRWRTGDSIAVVPLEDGIVVSKIEKENT